VATLTAGARPPALSGRQRSGTPPSSSCGQSYIAQVNLVSPGWRAHCLNRIVLLLVELDELVGLDRDWPPGIAAGHQCKPCVGLFAAACPFSVTRTKNAARAPRGYHGSLLDDSPRSNRSRRPTHRCHMTLERDSLTLSREEPESAVW